MPGGAQNRVYSARLLPLHGVGARATQVSDLAAPVALLVPRVALVMRMGVAQAEEARRCRASGHERLRMGLLGRTC